MFQRFLVALLSCAVGVGLSATLEYQRPDYLVVSQAVALATVLGSLVMIGLMIPLLKLPSPRGLFLTGAATILMPVILVKLLNLSTHGINVHGFAAWAFLTYVASCVLSAICLWTMAAIHAFGRRQ
jgi:hypothetical protein